MEKKSKKLLKKIFKLIQAPLDIKTSKWADEFRILSPEGSAEPGKWKTSTSIFQKEIMDAIDDGAVEKVTIKSSAQVGKTEILLNIVGKQIHLDPCPILVVQPTGDMAAAFSKERMGPMIRDTPVLTQRIKDIKEKDGGNTITHKIFPGGYIAFVGANSPSKLASRPIRIVLLDEVDRFPLSAKQEGDPVNLAEKRTNTFWNRKIIKVSTPTIKGISRIDKAYETSSMEEWQLPCPHCGEYQKLSWDRIEWKDKNSKVEMSCSHCGCLAGEKYWKKDKQIYGKWVALNPDNKKHRGFHINELASNWKTWEEMRDEFLDKKDDPEQLKTFINTSLGECWIENLKDEIDWEMLLNRREEYNAQLPDEVLILTAGVDVQDNRLELEVVGWGKDKERWGIEYKVFPGDPGQNDVWHRLENYLDREFSFEDGLKLKVACTCIDTGGHFTNETYEFIKTRQFSKRIFGIKGQGGEYVPIINGFNKSKDKKIDLLSIGVNTLKDDTYAALKVEEPGQNYCHFPLDINRGYGSDYFKSLTAEVKIIKNRKIEWDKIRERNEALDVRNYARAAFQLLDVDLDKLASLNKQLLPKVGFSKKKKIRRVKTLSKGVE